MCVCRTKVNVGNRDFSTVISHFNETDGERERQIVHGD